MNQELFIPLPSSEESKIAAGDKRLWIGNLDPRINEYQLLKLMQKHGPIEKFDLLFHRSGPLAGQPRGYAFITYETKEAAITAKTALHNKMVGTRRITVTGAHSMCNQEEPEKKKPELDIPALAGAKELKKGSRETQIQAIEAKLKMMENNSSNELEINKTVATEMPVISQYQQKTVETSQNSNNNRHRYNNHNRRQQSHPYNSKSRRR